MDTFLVIRNNSASCRVLVWSCVFISLACLYLSVELLVYMVLLILRNYQTIFQSGIYHFIFQPAVYQDSIFSTSSMLIIVFDIAVLLSHNAFIFHNAF